MLIAHCEGQRIEAWNAQKGPVYDCPECSGSLILKQGRIVVHHFAHKPPTSCSWATGETLAHLEAKKCVHETLIERGISAELEYRVSALSGDRRADVMAWSPDGKRQIAFELQHTPIDLNAIEMRAASYAASEIAQIWIPFLSKNTMESADEISDGSLFVEQYPARQFERWIHGLNGADGMWMYAAADKTFWHARLTAHTIYVPQTDWYGEGGEEMSAGGYSRYSKKFKELKLVGPYKFGQLCIRLKKRKAVQLAHYNWPAGLVATLEVLKTEQ